MCGLAGLLVSGDSGMPDGAVENMSRVLRHRGPDDVGYLSWDGRSLVPTVSRAEPTKGSRIAFAHRRLSILDLTDAGWQPMSSRDGRLALVYNGELYNHIELASELTSRGHLFKSRCDTEVVLAAYAEWGVKALERFRGMFALAVVDIARRELVLARDHFGIKPLFYASWDGGLAFASEIKALLKLPAVSTTADPTAVYRYLRFGMTDRHEQTMFRDIRRLPAGALARVPLDGPLQVAPRTYWSLDSVERHDIGRQEAADAVRDSFLRSVEMHMRSDVPIGAALSGGIDSSAIVGAMRHIGGPKLDLSTFSYLPQHSTNEAPWVQAVVDKVRPHHHVVDFTPPDLVTELDSVICAHDEPFSSTSMYAQFRVFQAARRAGVPVMLDGQGADELFAGYRPHLIARCGTLLRRGDVVKAARFAHRVAALPGSPSALRVLSQAASGAAPDVLLTAARRLRSEELMPPYLDGSWFARAGVEGHRMVPRRGIDTLSDVLRDGVRNTLADLLRYEDRNSMAHSVESRVPFLDPDLAELAFSLPEHLLISQSAVSKSILREAVSGLVPLAVLNRRDKVGFETPERDLLGALRPWVQQTLDGLDADRVPALDVPEVFSRWNEITLGRRPLDPSVWRWLNIIRWTDLYHVTYPV